MLYVLFCLLPISSNFLLAFNVTLFSVNKLPHAFLVSLLFPYLNFFPATKFFSKETGITVKIKQSCRHGNCLRKIWKGKT